MGWHILAYDRELQWQQRRHHTRCLQNDTRNQQNKLRTNRRRSDATTHDVHTIYIYIFAFFSLEKNVRFIRHSSTHTHPNIARRARVLSLDRVYFIVRPFRLLHRKCANVQKAYRLSVWSRECNCEIFYCCRATTNARWVSW